jgi:hypothetical protein
MAAQRETAIVNCKHPTAERPDHEGFPPSEPSPGRREKVTAFVLVFQKSPRTLRQNFDPPHGQGYFYSRLVYCATRRRP